MIIKLTGTIQSKNEYLERVYKAVPTPGSQEPVSIRASLNAFAPKDAEYDFVRKCFISISFDPHAYGSEYTTEIPPGQYAELNVGDKVSLEVTPADESKTK